MSSALKGDDIGYVSPVINRQLMCRIQYMCDPKLKGRRWMENEGGVVRLLF
jgi:hypothetical protein